MSRRLLVGIALSLAAACGRQPTASDAVREELIVPVAAQPATVGRVRAILHATGVVSPAPDAEFIVTAPEPARIVEITHAEGEPVQAGELLVRFDIPSLNGDAARQRADMARVRAEFENARVTQTRARDFADRGLIARRELEDADRALADAQAAVSRAEAAQTATAVAAARASVRAPFAGVVAKRLHNPGDVVSGAATDPILRIVDPRRLEVIASVPLQELSRVLPGATARVVSAAEPIRLSVVSRPGPGEARPDGTVAVRLTMTGAGMPLAVDAPVQVDIDLGERDGAVLVPPEAIVREGQQAAVFVAAGTTAERREVTTGVTDDHGVEITSGVRAGELVITRGHTGLANGATISVDAGLR
jgi:RND family efflux transporter MFP subunit